MYIYIRTLIDVDEQTTFKPTIHKTLEGAQSHDLSDDEFDEWEETVPGCEWTCHAIDAEYLHLVIEKVPPLP